MHDLRSALQATRTEATHLLRHAHVRVCPKVSHSHGGRGVARRQQRRHRVSVFHHAPPAQLVEYGDDGPLLRRLRQPNVADHRLAVWVGVDRCHLAAQCARARKHRLPAVGRGQEGRVAGRRGQHCKRGAPSAADTSNQARGTAQRGRATLSHLRPHLEADEAGLCAAPQHLLGVVGQPGGVVVPGQA